MTNKNPDRETTNPGNCQFCGIELPVPRHIANKTCEGCKASYQHKYDEVNKQQRLIKNRKYYQDNRERLVQYTRERWASFSKEEQQFLRRRYTLSTRYGLSATEYDALLERQGGGCAVCGKKPNGEKMFPIDHDHACCPGRKSCGKCIRGILCFYCNVLIGYLEKSKDLIPKCEAYLALPSANTQRT